MSAVAKGTAAPADRFWEWLDLALAASAAAALLLMVITGLGVI